MNNNGYWLGKFEQFWVEQIEIDKSGIWTHNLQTTNSAVLP